MAALFGSSSRCLAAFAGGLLFVAPGAGDAWAQNVSAVSTQAIQSTGVISYPASFFNEFRPSNAFDMVQRVPGFTYSRGSTDVRGFAGSGGNVFIDGAPPTSKSVTLDDVLRRIPASSIQQIDLIRGGAPGIDMQGQSVIANVIRKNEASTTFALQHDLRIYPDDGKFGSIARLEAARRVSDWSIESNLFFARNKNTMAGGGYGRITRLTGSGAFNNAGPYIADYLRNRLQWSAVLEANAGEGVLHVNSALDMDKPKRNDIATVTNSLGVTTREQSITTQNTDKYELGADYETKLFGLDTRFLTLQRLEYDRTTSSSATRTSNTSLPSSETIFRTTWGAAPLSWLSWEAGGEGAYNSLDASSKLAVGGVPQIVPNANVKVEEKRGELFGTANLTPVSGLRLETGLRWENSVISQSGDTNKEKSFSFPKPRLIAAYDLTPTTQLRARLEREVGQLDFTSFAAANDASLGTVTAGNADLEPERSWVYEAALEQRFWGKGAVVFTYTHYNVEAVNDQIPVFTSAGSFDAPGNIGDGTKDQFKLNFSLPLSNIGWPNATFRGENTIRLSSVTDPVTAQTRRISGEIPITILWTFIQDFPSWNSTFTTEVNWESKKRTYRIREVRREGQDPRIRLTWDWKYQPDILIRLEAESVFRRVRERNRIFYSGTRASGTVSSSEHLDVVYDPYINISIRKTF